MVRIEEITDEMADRLKVSSQDGPSAASDAAVTGPQATEEGVGPELSPGRGLTQGKTVDEVWADLKKSPLFMTELEENDDTEALKALAYEGTPLEVATDFKERGNTFFKLKRWGDAKEFYGKGILVLAAEERKRARGEPSEGDPDAEEIKSQKAALETLYVNRAACHLELKNYRSCWLDGAAALRLNPKNIKAYYRSAKALLAVGRIEEADDACARGLTLDETNAPLQAVARDIIKRNEEITAKKRKEDERVARQKRQELLLKAALKAREIKTRETKQAPEMEDAKIQLVPDPDDPKSSLSFPAVLLYSAHLQSDFIKAFNEMENVSDHLGYVFPLPWDDAKEYTLAGVECYMETVTGGLIKVGKKVPLLKMLSGGKVEVVDQLVKIHVLPKSKAEDWVKSFKEKKAAEKTGG